MAKMMGVVNSSADGHERRAIQTPPLVSRSRGRMTPALVQNGAIRFRGFTKISRRIRPASIRSVRRPGNRTGRNAKFQNTYIVVYGLSSLRDSVTDARKFANQAIPTMAHASDT